MNKKVKQRYIVNQLFLYQPAVSVSDRSGFDQLL